MQELSKALDAVMDTESTLEKAVHDREPGELGQAAIKWSTWCLRNLTGDLLKRGLLVSKALAEFDEGLLYPQVLKD